MNWLWILMLAALGVLAAVLNIFGVLPSSMWLSIGLVLVVSVGLGYNVKGKLFLHGFLTALIWTLVGGALQLAFWDTMIANHPEMQERLSQAPAGMNMQVLFIFGIVVGGALWGVVLGLLTMLSGKLLAEKPVAKTTVSSPVPEEKADITGK